MVSLSQKTYTINVFLPSINGTFRMVTTTKVRHRAQFEILIDVPYEKSQLVSVVD